MCPHTTVSFYRKLGAMILRRAHMFLVLAYSMRAELNATLEATKKKDAPTKKLSLNDFIIKVLPCYCLFCIQLIEVSCVCPRYSVFLVTYRIREFAGCSLGFEEGSRGQQFLDRRIHQTVSACNHILVFQISFINVSLDRMCKFDACLKSCGGGGWMTLLVFCLYTNGVSRSLVNFEVSWTKSKTYD